MNGSNTTIKINRIKAGERISHALKDVGISDSELSSRLGVSRSAISSWKNGRYYPSIENLIMLSDITSYPVEYFVPVIRGVPRC